MRPDINQPSPGPGDPQTRRPNNNFGRIYYSAPDASSNYHSFQMRVEKRFSAGFSILSAYTFSKAIDNDDLAWQIPQNSYDLRAERSLSNFHIRHRFVSSYLYELPLGPGKKYAAAAPNGVAKLVEGWKVAGITVFSSGPPSTPVLPFDSPNVGYEWSVARPDRIGSGKLANRSWQAYWDKNAFVTPAPYTFGNAGRNILIWPGINNWDIGLLKDARIKEGQNLEFRAKFFNAFNHPVSGDQIQSALGSDALSLLAQRAGVAPSMASSLLAQLLPAIVDHLTPEGKIPESGNLREQGLNILEGLKNE